MELAKKAIIQIDLASYVGADLDVMARDSKRMRGRPFIFSNLRIAGCHY